MLFKLPSKTFYAAYLWRDGTVTFGENTYDDASDALSEATDHDGDFRILCLEMDPDTNLPERTTDVTEDTIREYHCTVYANRSEREAVEDAA